MSERIVGKNCTVSMTDTGGTATVLSHWTKYTVETTLETAEARSATATYQQVVEKYKSAKVTVEGWRGGDDAFMDDVAVGDVVTVSGTNFPSLTGYGVAKVTSKKHDQNEDPGTWSLDIAYGFVDVA